MAQAQLDMMAAETSAQGQAPEMPSASEFVETSLMNINADVDEAGDDAGDAQFDVVQAQADEGAESNYEDVDESKSSSRPKKRKVAPRPSTTTATDANGVEAAEPSTSTKGKGRWPGGKKKVKKAKVEKTAATGPKSTCHNCHQSQPRMADLVICKATRAWTLTGKPAKPLPCAQTFCQRCLNKYAIDGKTIPEDWECPVCALTCTCSTCRKARGDTPHDEIRAQRAKACDELLEQLANADQIAAEKAAKKEADKEARAKAKAEAALRGPVLKLPPVLYAPTFTPIEGLPSPDDVDEHRDTLLSRLYIREVYIRFKSDILPGLGADRSHDRGKHLRPLSLAALSAMSIDPVGFWDRAGSSATIAAQPNGNASASANVDVELENGIPLDSVRLSRHLLAGALALYARQATHDGRPWLANDQRLVATRNALKAGDDRGWILAADFFGDRDWIPVQDPMQVDGSEDEPKMLELPPERKLAILELVVDKILPGEIIRTDLADGEKRLTAARTDLANLKKDRKKQEQHHADAEPAESKADQHEDWIKAGKEAEYQFEEAVARNFCQLQQQRLRLAPTGQDLIGNSYYILSPALNAPANDEPPLYVYGPGPTSNKTAFSMPPAPKPATNGTPAVNGDAQHVVNGDAQPQPMVNGDVKPVTGDAQPTANGDQQPIANGATEDAPAEEDTTQKRWWMFKTAEQIRELGAWIQKMRGTAVAQSGGGKKRVRGAAGAALQGSAAVTAAASLGLNGGSAPAPSDAGSTAGSPGPEQPVASTSAMPIASEPAAPASDAGVEEDGKIVTRIRVPFGAVIPFVTPLQQDLDAYADFIDFRVKQRAAGRRPQAPTKKKIGRPTVTNAAATPIAPSSKAGTPIKSATAPTMVASKAQVPQEDEEIDELASSDDDNMSLV